jgi:hypothetical protein
LQKTVRFTYDGWNMIEEEQLQDSGSGFQPLAVTRHTWGADVSGTLQGAGGVGGLLRSDETIGTNTTTTHYYWYDGNGNVTGLMRGNGTVDATYRYCAPSPSWIGQVIRRANAIHRHPQPGLLHGKNCAGKAGRQPIAQVSGGTTSISSI